MYHRRRHVPRKKKYAITIRRRVRLLITLKIQPSANAVKDSKLLLLLLFVVFAILPLPYYYD